MRRSLLLTVLAGCPTRAACAPSSVNCSSLSTPKWSKCTPLQA